MATKKINVRKDYSYVAKKRLPQYDRAKIPRKPQFLILRGPGLDPRTVMEENAELREFADKQKIKLKFLQAKDEVELITVLKESNTWAAGVVLNMGSLNEDSELVRKTITKLLCSTTEISGEGSYVDALKKLMI